jgi:PIN domain nuclease of toxin-antitoxin system
MAAREIGQLSMIDALALVACYARTGCPKFDQAAVRWLERLAAERHASLRDIRLAAAALEALQTKHHDPAEKMLLRFL